MQVRASALYEGRVWHTRFKPKRHRLGYRIFMLLLDLDELPALAAELNLFGLGRFGLTSFREQDHLTGTKEPVRDQIEAHLAAAGLAGGGPIRVLSMPRVLGSAFNPISVWFCHARDGALSAILYEVNNTFGQRHSYLLPVSEVEEGGAVRQGSDKHFHVSPLMDMDLSYAFRVTPPLEGQPFSLGVMVSDAEGPILSTAFAARRTALSDRSIAGAVARHPLLMLKVLGAIHWEAIKLLLKGLKLRPAPPLPPTPVTVGS